MFNLKINLIVFIMVACQINCMACGYCDKYDYATDYIRRSKMQTDINLQHSMMQSQVNAMYNQSNYQSPAPIRQYDVDSKVERPTFVIEKPLYKFGE